MNPEMNPDYLLDQHAAGQITLQELQALLPGWTLIDLQQAVSLHHAAQIAIQREAVRQQVLSIHRQWVPQSAYHSLSSERSRPTVSMFPIRRWLQVAAIVLILIGSVSLIQWISTQDESLYQSLDQRYQLNTQRSATSEMQSSVLVERFKAVDYEGVINAYLQLPVSNNREKFLAASAYRALGKDEASIPLLKAIMQQNKSDKTRMYQDEAEYYLALCYLKLNQPERAYGLLKKVFEDPTHTYHAKVSRWTLFRVRWL